MTNMRRKIIKQGIGGNTIFLPVKWVKEHNLNPGDEVDISTLEQDLLISTEHQIQKKSTTLKLTSENEHFIRISINALYRLGYDKIKVLFSKQKQADFVKKTIEERLIGFEVVEEEKDYLIIENVTEPSEEKQEILLRRMFLIVKETFSLVFNDLKLSNFNQLDMISQQTKRLNKYNSFCRRNVSKKRFKEPKIAYYWELYLKILLIQHSLLHLYEIISKEKPKEIAKNTLNSFASLQEFYTELYESFFKKDFDLIRKVNEKTNKNLYNHIHPLMKKASKKEVLLYFYLGELSRMIYLATIPALAILLD